MLQSKMSGRASHIIQSGMPLWKKVCHLEELKKLKIDFRVTRFSPARYFFLHGIFFLFPNQVICANSIQMYIIRVAVNNCQSEMSLGT